MTGLTCSQCGAPIDPHSDKCQYCGSVIEKAAPAAPLAPQVMYPTAPMQSGLNQSSYNSDGINMSWPIKNRATAAILAILLGVFGAHKFYLGKTGAGVLYLFLTFTGALAPFIWIIGVVEGITYLTQNEHNFQVKNKVRTK